MKTKIINTILIILVLQGCSKKNIDTELLGNWSSTKSSNIVDLQFFEDSLVTDTWDRKTKFSWKSNASKIYYTQLTNLDSKLETDFIFDYKLNSQKDTLYLKKETDSSFTNQFLKINNAYQYFEKNINLNINLLNKESELISSGNKKFDFNIYLGYKNGQIIAKTDNSINLNRIEIYDLISSTNDSEINKIKYLLFTDKKIPEKQVDSIKKILRETSIKKIFRVYTNENVDYKKNHWKTELNWFGKYE
ncbi:hypothetical protein ACFSX9_03910 [Flavobacterium ardleyense]|uniref:Lipoprotein n=1 Tax=Flavobacterium ardleyense TaxID=2038737 RepID=A0ABW5Z4V6_9FLAO